LKVQGSKRLKVKIKIMEESFLQYLLYTVLIDVRARASENGDTVSFGLCNLLHNVPISLASGRNAKEVYKVFIEKVEADGLQDWLIIRQKEFNNRFNKDKPA
jgi:hypothetical protein